MALLHTLAAIGRFIRRAPPPPVDLLEAYAHEVIPVMDRAEWLYEHWLEQSTLFTDGEKLGNVAAIHRWETATMGRSLERVIPPAVLAGPHEQVVDALELASRAAQLLSNGSRFHNANAVCEGQAMLAVSRERRLAALRSMRRYLARIQPAPAAQADAASSGTLAEAASLVALNGQAPADGPALDAAPANAEHSVAPSDADAKAVWPEGAELDLIVTDEAEPEPAWLSAAQAGTSQSETAAAQPDQPVPAEAPARLAEPADAAPMNTPREAPVPDPPASETPAPTAPSPEKLARSGGDGGDPSERAGWGSLFARPNE